LNGVRISVPLPARGLVNRYIRTTELCHNNKVTGSLADAPAVRERAQRRNHMAVSADAPADVMTKSSALYYGSGSGGANESAIPRTLQRARALIAQQQAATRNADCIDVDFSTMTSATTEPTHVRPTASKCQHVSQVFGDSVLTLRHANQLKFGAFRHRLFGGVNMPLRQFFCYSNSSAAQPAVSVELLRDRDSDRVPFNYDMFFIADPSDGIFPPKARHRGAGSAAPACGVAAVSSGPSGMQGADCSSTRARGSSGTAKSRRGAKSSGRARTYRRGPLHQKPFMHRLHATMTTAELVKRLDFGTTRASSGAGSDKRRDDPLLAGRYDQNTGASDRVYPLTFDTSRDHPELSGHVPPVHPVDTFMFPSTVPGMASRRDTSSSSDESTTQGPSTDLLHPPNQANGDGSEAAFPIRFDLKKLRPFLSAENGRLLEREMLPHVQLRRWFPTDPPSPLDDAAIPTVATTSGRRDGYGTDAHKVETLPQVLQCIRAVFGALPTFDDADPRVPLWVLSGLVPDKELYRGPSFYYVWYPLDLADRRHSSMRPNGSMSTVDRRDERADIEAEDALTYHYYMGVVNRVDALERMIQHDAPEPLPIEIRKQLVALQDMYQMLTLFMTTYCVFSDQHLCRAALFQNVQVTTDPLSWRVLRAARRHRNMLETYSRDHWDSVERTRVTLDAAASMWSMHSENARQMMSTGCAERLYRDAAETAARAAADNQAECVDGDDDIADAFVRDQAYLHANGEPPMTFSYLDAFFPSYEFVFHEGELPDLTTIIRSMAIATEGLHAELTVRDQDVLSLRAMLNKGLPQPSRRRDVDIACSEKCEENELVSDCLQRMVFATLGGYYEQATPVSWYTRNILYRWFQFCPPYIDQFCAWISGHKRLDLDGLTEIEVPHADLVLHVIKEYLLNSICLMPEVQDHMSKYFWFDEMTYATHTALEKVRQTTDDVYYGCGERWIRLERRYFRYVSRPEQQRISQNLTRLLGPHRWDPRRKRVCNIPQRKGTSSKRKQESRQREAAAAAFVMRDHHGVFHDPAAIDAIYNRALNDFQAEQNAIEHSPAIMHEVRYTVRGPGGVDVEGTPTARCAECVAAGVGCDSPYVAMHHMFDTLMPLSSVAIQELAKHRAPPGTVPITLPDTINNGIVRLLVDFVVSYADEGVDDTSAIRATHDPQEHAVRLDSFIATLASMLCLKLEWVGRWGNECMEVAELLRRVIDDDRYVYAIQYALELKAEHRILFFEPYRCAQHEPEEAYCKRWLDAIENHAHNVVRTGMKALRVDAQAAIKKYRVLEADDVVQCEELRAEHVRAFLETYIGPVATPVAEDHRFSFSQLHGISMVHGNGLRCSCPQCVDESDVSDRALYAEFQQTINGVSGGNHVFNGVVNTLSNSILRDTYASSLCYLYRTPPQPFMQHVVEQMWSAVEAHKSSQWFKDAVNAITDDEIQFITSWVARFPRWKHTPIEWMSQAPLKLRWKPLAMMSWARCMYETNTYPIDTRNAVRAIIAHFPREFLLLQHFYNEVHSRRSAVLYKLPHDVAQQQLATACKKYGVNIAHGDRLPSIATTYYYCPAHGDIKRSFYEHQARSRTSFGHVNLIFDPRDGCVYCNMTFGSEGATQGSARALNERGPTDRSRGQVSDMAYDARKIESQLTWLATLIDTALEYDYVMERLGMSRDAIRDLTDAFLEQKRLACMRFIKQDRPQSLFETIRLLDGLIHRFTKCKLDQVHEPVQMLLGLCREDSKSGSRDSDAFVSDNDKDDNSTDAESAMEVEENDAVDESASRQQQPVRLQLDKRSKGDQSEGRFMVNQWPVESPKSEVQHMQDIQCGGPLPHVNLIGHVFLLNGRMFTLCPLCLTLMIYNRFSFDEFGMSCGMCTRTLRAVTPKSIVPFIRVRCFDCGEMAPLHHPRHVSLHTVLDDTRFGFRRLRYIYLCPEHEHGNVGTSEEIFGVNAVRQYIHRRVKRIGMGSHADGSKRYFLVDANIEYRTKGAKHAPFYDANRLRRQMQEFYRNPSRGCGFLSNRSHVRTDDSDHHGTVGEQLAWQQSASNAVSKPALPLPHSRTLAKYHDDESSDQPMDVERGDSASGEVMGAGYDGIWTDLCDEEQLRATFHRLKRITKR